MFISVGISQSDLATVFGDVTQADTVTCRYCMPYEDNLPVYVNRQPKLSLRDAWPGARHFD